MLHWQLKFSIDNYLEKVNCNIALIEKAYIQQVTAQKHFDYNDKILLKILAKDNAFLMDYIDALSQKSDLYSISEDRKLSVVWQIDNIELVLKNVFDVLAKKHPFLGISEHFCNSFFYNLPDMAKARATDFLLGYANDNYMDSNKVNIVLDITRHTMHGLFDKILLQHINTTPDVKLFESIWWVQSGGVYHGDVIIGDIKAAQWRNVLSIVEQSGFGIKLIPIKRYINSEIESSLRYAELERKRKFIEDR